MNAKSPAQKNAPPLGIARYLAWVSLVLILCFAVTLAIVFGNTARETLLSKQRNFAGLLAENLNHQIFVRFTLPTVVGFGRIALWQPAQYERLDQVVQTLIHGMHVQSLRIFNQTGVVTYSAANKEEVRSEAFVTPSITAAIDSAEAPIFNIDAAIPFWKAFFFFRLEPGTFYLRTTYPMRIENRLNSFEPTGALLGVLEFTQDITDDITSVVRFQWSIIGITLISALLLFLLLMLFLRRAEAALAVRMDEEQRLLRELHQHEKLAGMGRVVAGIAHEIRNPLGIIRSSAELILRRQGNSDPANAKILGAIFDESRRLSQTVSDFLDYARPRQPMRNPVDTERVLHEVTAFLEAELAQRDIELIREFPQNAGPFIVAGDKDLLYRAFYNILMNAIQAVDKEGVLRVAARWMSEDGQNLLVLQFSDSGPGFPANDREKLLDPFFTTKDGGTGLGLPIVNNIITSHGGSMTLGDAPGGGALVRVTLPAMPS